MTWSELAFFVLGWLLGGLSALLIMSTILTVRDRRRERSGE